EARFKAAMKQPVDQQPIDELLAMYKGLQTDTTLGDYEQRVVRARIAQLNRNAELAAGIKHLSELREKAGKPIEVPKPDMVTIPGTGQQPRYDAVGQLLASSVY